MGAKRDRTFVEEWRRRISASEDTKKNWEKENRVSDSYQFWRGNQLVEPFDERSDRKMQINLVHTAARAQVPSLYFYRPFARIHAAPERADTSGETVDDKATLLQDTANYLIRDGVQGFREQTHLGVKEAFWAMGCVEVGYSAEFTDNPNADRPALKEDEDTEVDLSQPVKDEDGLSVGPDSDLPSLEAELARLKSSLKSETFYVKHIPARQVLVSATDKCIIDDNDWVGYWEEFPLEDIRDAPGYKNTRELKGASHGSRKEDRADAAYSDNKGDVICLYKIWDLRTRTRYVIAEGHDAYLLKKPFKRLPLKFLRPDVDPYHFYPKPPISNWLIPQEEYNDSREYLRKVRKGTVPLFTYDENGVDPKDMEKFEGGQMGTYIPRRANTNNPIEPVQQPNYSGNAIQTLTISEKEFNSISGIPSEYRQTQEDKTATASVIQNQQAQVQNNFDRSTVADWLAAIIQELVCLAIEKMSLDHWIAINVDPDSAFAPQAAVQVATQFQQLTADKLASAAKGIRWVVQVDVESLSPVAEEQQLGRWMQALSLLLNPGMARLMALAPPILKRTLDLNGIKSGRDQDAIGQALTAMAQLEMQMQQAQINGGGGAAAPKGVASQPGAPAQAPQAGGPPQQLPTIPNPHPRQQ